MNYKFGWKMSQCQCHVYKKISTRHFDLGNWNDTE